LPEDAALHAAPARPTDEVIGLKLDVGRLLRALTPTSHAVAVALTELSPSEAARELGVHRSTIYACLKLIREVAVDLGLAAYLARPDTFGPRPVCE
jgi:hypothetical protein